eukprot:maker-scaffold_16-snap-gene-3.9-mRNA-1 protein AED:0.00 eAED:0.00 QI:260/1/1/1/1/1/2/296/536
MVQMPNRVKKGKEKCVTSLSVFQKHVPIDPNTGRSRILSADCFNQWVQTRKKTPKEPEKSFRKALMAHLRKKDGRNPFTAEEEGIVLKELRRNEPWPCFANRNNGSYLTIGSRFSNQPGYHESLRIGSKRASTEIEPEKDENAQLKELFESFPFDEKKFKSISLLEETIKSFAESNILEYNPNIAPFDSFTGSVGYDKDTILSTFSDVSCEEVKLICDTREVLLNVFRKTYDVKDIQQIYPDICGDIKLLRILRSHYYDVDKACAQIKATIAWRKKYGIDDIRKKLIEQNPNIRDLTDGFKISDRKTAFPFFSIFPNGNVFDIWYAVKRYTEDDNEIFKAVGEHFTLLEFRNIFFDRISRLKRKIVRAEAVIDFSAVNDNDSWDSIEKFDAEGFNTKREKASSPYSQSKTHPEIDGLSRNVAGLGYDWFQRLKTHSWYLKQIFGAYASHSPHSFRSLHLLGKGYIFNIIAVNIISAGIGSVKEQNIINVYNSREELKNALHLITKPDTLPLHLGGTVEDPNGTDISKVKLNSLTRR